MITFSDHPSVIYKYRVSVNHFRNDPMRNEIYQWSVQLFTRDRWFITVHDWYIIFHFKYEEDRTWFIMRWS